MSVAVPKQNRGALGNSVKFTWKSCVMVHAHIHARAVVQGLLTGKGSASHVDIELQDGDIPDADSGKSRRNLHGSPLSNFHHTLAR